ncbi:MAG: Ribosomal-protein-alanine N-acetyltransferase [Nitrospirota bacterium]|jgi:ribosomal-protein-alanine N-acetyltransferase
MDRAIRIVPATLADLPDLLRLEEACFSAPWTRKMLEAELTGNQFAHFLVAREPAKAATTDGAIVGSLCFWIVFEEVRLMNLAVAEQMRRRGIAAALVEAALRAGVTQAATRAVLEVRASNHAALALYRRFGFAQVSVRPAYYSNPVEDAVLMEMEPIVIPAGSGRASAPVNEGGSVSAH